MKTSPLRTLLISCYLAAFFTSPLYAQDSEQVLTSVIATQKQQLPIMLDPATRINDISYADHNILYDITLAGYQGQPGEKVYYESYLRQQIDKTLCSQTAYLFLLGLGNKITYRYVSADATPITEITLAPGHCKR